MLNSEFDRCDVFNRSHKGDTVYLSHSNLQVVPEDLSGGAMKVYLDHNNIERLEAGDFIGCGNFTMLDLSFNSIRYTGAGTFVGTPRLEHLKLDGNKLNYGSLPGTAFTGLSKLEYLNIADNTEY